MNVAGLDVLHLDRAARMLSVDPATTARHLLHEHERDEAVTAHDLAASLTAKEAWIKLCGRRPAGWSFSDAYLCDAYEAPDAHATTVQRAMEHDLGTAGATWRQLANTGHEGSAGARVVSALAGNWLITVALP